MASDSAALTDELGVDVNGEPHGVEVKGPDPDVWPAEPVDALPESAPGKKTLPQNRWLEQGNSARPPQSDERREGMPMAASLTKEGVVYVPMPRVAIDPAAQMDDGTIREGAGMLQLGPTHIGRRASLNKDEDLDDQFAAMGWS